MISCHSNYFQVVINMSQVPIDLSPPRARLGGGGGEIAQLIPNLNYSLACTVCADSIFFCIFQFLLNRYLKKSIFDLVMFENSEIYVNSDNCVLIILRSVSIKFLT